MKINIQRKCKACKGTIDINRNNVQGVVYYKDNYYHTSCFCEHAEKKSVLKNGKLTEWANALSQIKELENDAKEVLRVDKPKPKLKRETDDLNDYLLSQYNVSAVSSRNFWRMVQELKNGTYRGRRCKKVSLETLLEAWKWYQQKLNEKDKCNKMHNKGPKNDDGRIPYDFAIIVTKIPEYLAYKAKQDAYSAELTTKIERITAADMQRAVVKCEGLDDISDLLDDDD